MERKRFLLLRLNRVVIILVLLFALNLNADNKSILWITNSNSDVEEVLKFKKEKSLDFSFTLACDLCNLSNISVEKVDSFIGFYPVLPIFFPSFTNFKNISNYQDSSDIFSYFLDYARSISSTSSQGFFSIYPIMNNDISKILKSRGYNWAFGGTVKSNPGSVDFDGLKFVFFETLKSSYTIFASSNTFFVVNDILNSTSSVSLLKDVFSLQGVKFLTVSDTLKLYNSTDAITYKEDVDLSSFLKCDKAFNYLSFLSLIVSELNNYSNLTHDTFFSLYNLIGYFDSICSDDIDDIEDIRKITKQMYQNLNKEIPYFIYYDFLNNSFIKKYKKIVSNNNISFDSISAEMIKKFEVIKNDSDYLFDIILSTTLIDGEIHIYADMNKRRNAGIDWVIGRSDRLDPLYAWEYSIIINISKRNGVLYKAGYRDFSKVISFPVEITNEHFSFKISSKDIQGNPIRWNYIVPVYSKNILGGIYELSDSKFLTISQ